MTKDLSSFFGCLRALGIESKTASAGIMNAVRKPMRLIQVITKNMQLNSGFQLAASGKLRG
ncbi:MAG: hypothetical protein COW03_00610 [Cytophagales bacterium CG12_big_fil_rev_8_21_14_0_65_40_12]|nr:MAG: hypothetical protein COW03_00610 [Cytophagales bacterium CG12_big_fil_rev_8_21_14_0_65_40_12]PIW05408.1 MAG: hypothetical protein COW40_04895 [Cytophagales bacterium CG17_big_fil_post_rev_8_21_14_2_50_40_13]